MLSSWFNSAMHNLYDVFCITAVMSLMVCFPFCLACPRITYFSPCLPWERVKAASSLIRLGSVCRSALAVVVVRITRTYYSKECCSQLEHEKCVKNILIMKMKRYRRMEKREHSNLMFIITNKYGPQYDQWIKADSNWLNFPSIPVNHISVVKGAI